MKKRVFLNLVMGISLIATPAFLLASCSQQASDVKLATTVKDVPDVITVHEFRSNPITLTTVQKLFNVEASDFNNVTVSLKNDNVAVGQKNQVVLTAKDGYIFENGKSLESSEFTISKTTLQITAKSTADGISAEEVSAKPITLVTIQKLFNIEASDFDNVTADLKNPAGALTNQVVLTAKDDFMFEGGISIIDSAVFNLSKQLAITAKTLEEAAPFIPHAEIIASPIALLTIQKMFNIVQADFENVIVDLKEVIKPGSGNMIILTAKDGFIFTNGNNTLESQWFTIPGTK